MPPTTQNALKPPSWVLDRNRLWTVMEVARFLGISRRQVFYMCDRGTLTRIRFSDRGVRFDPVEVKNLGPYPLKRLRKKRSDEDPV